MFSVKTLRLVVPVVSLFAFVGCETFDKGAPQPLTVNSYPPRAEVFVGGESMGFTPVEIELHRKMSHQIEVVKEGYRSESVLVGPVANDKADNFVKFGLMDEAGYYADLSPNPISVQLRPEVLPTVPGYDAFSEMTSAIQKVDAKRESGEISAEEHKYQVEQIIKFYGN